MGRRRGRRGRKLRNRREADLPFQPVEFVEFIYMWRATGSREGLTCQAEFRDGKENRWFNFSVERDLDEVVLAKVEAVIRHGLPQKQLPEGLAEQGFGVSSFLVDGHRVTVEEISKV